MKLLVPRSSLLDITFLAYMELTLFIKIQKILAVFADIPKKNVTFAELSRNKGNYDERRKEYPRPKEW